MHHFLFTGIPAELDIKSMKPALSPFPLFSLIKAFVLPIQAYSEIIDIAKLINIIQEFA